MPSLNFGPALSLLLSLPATRLRPLHLLVRATEERLRPSRICLHTARECRAQDACREQGLAGARRGATLLREAGQGRVPTIVLGGFVPDATEQVFLLRRFLLQAGDVFYVTYPREDFSLDLLCAQLDDLVAEISAAGQAPVVLGVSFGAGVALEWLRRARARGAEPRLGGVVLVSPVACLADVMAPGAEKAATLLGRALKPYVDPAKPLTEAGVEKSRAVFMRMFEAGAQNKAALRLLMTAPEVERLRERVMGAIRGITLEGARERVRALTLMAPLTESFSPDLVPLTRAPALVLFAEREEAVLDPRSPTRFALQHATRAYLPHGRVHLVGARNGASPVQHASLIFHVFEFLPHLERFYRDVRQAGLPLAA